jgi:probable HAF family extracellular repeat protein
MPVLKLLRNLTLACLPAVASLAHGAPAYRVQVVHPSLNSSGVDGLNSHGVGIGLYRVGVADGSALLAYTFDTGAGTHQVLRSLGHGHVDYPGDINDSGLVALTHQDATDWDHVKHRAEVYDANARTFTVLPSGTASGASYAFGINNAGVVAGASAFNTTAAQEMHAVVWKNGGIIDLGGPGGDSYARAINDNGVVAGETTLTGDGSVQAFLHDGAGMTLLGTLGGYYSRVAALNNSNTVVGGSHLADGGQSAFIYQHGVMAPMGLSGNSEALDINNMGVAVGYSDAGGFIYADGQATLLDTLIDPASGWHVLKGGAINDLGQVGASVCKPGGLCYAAVLIPVPEPAAWLMLLGGLGLYGALARRRDANLLPGSS